jgi:hypothetical protein
MLLIKLPAKQTENLVLVFIMLYKIKTFYNYWLPSAICRRFPCRYG